MRNRNALIVNTELFETNGTAGRDAALVMLEEIPGTKQVTVGGDKAYDTADFVAEGRKLNVTSHVAQNKKLLIRLACGLLVAHHHLRAAKPEVSRGPMTLYLAQSG